MRLSRQVHCAFAYKPAVRQQRTGGAIVSFEVKGGREPAWKVIDSTKLISITGNLGDVKTDLARGLG